MQQLILATDFMHRKGIIHRDLKPQNILIIDSSVLMVCIADLGLAIRVNDVKRRHEQCGTPGYVDPDVLNGRPFTFKSDIFSLGSLFFNLVTHRLVFPGMTAEEVLFNNKNVAAGPFVDKYCQFVSPLCRDLLRKMLNRNEKRRPSAEECLKHSWF